MMLEGAGFEVIDLGINNPVENYIKASEEHRHIRYVCFANHYNALYECCN